MEKILSQQKKLLALLKCWVLCSSGSYDQKGLQRMAELLKESFSSLGGTFQALETQSWEDLDQEGNIVSHTTEPALFWRKRPEAPKQILFGGHYDTVFSFREPVWEENQEGKILGSGAADMKGGLLMLHAVVSALEESPLRDSFGWGIWLNPDEEIGSPASLPSLEKIAPDFDLALWFEPALPNGNCVRERKGSINFSWLSLGERGHAGRDFFSRRHAITPLIKALHELDQLTSKEKGVSVNIGTIHGGEAKNIIPEKAFCGVNIRFNDGEDEILNEIQRIGEQYQLQCIGKTIRPPKKSTRDLKALIELFGEQAEKQGLSISWEDTGGACDGNHLAGWGIPTIDTLGPVGQNLHSFYESIDPESLIPRVEWVTETLKEWIQYD